MQGRSKNQRELLCLLQLAGGTFPTGGFSQSWGLETYVSRGEIKDCQQFQQFLQMYLENVLVKCEGPVLCRAYALGEAFPTLGMDSLECNESLKNGALFKELVELDQLITAMKLTRESKEASLRTGKALLRIMAAVKDDPVIKQFYGEHQRQGVNFPVTFGLVCGRLEVGCRNALESFIFNSINGLIQSAVKLVPLGNSEAQQLSFTMQQSVLQGADSAEKIDVTEISNFCPGLDIASMNHEDLSTRLYMS